MEKKHPWKARFIVSAIMLLLAFLGMVVTDVKATGSWDYWKWVVPIYALLALWLSWYIRRRKETISPITLGHEVAHWAGVVASVFLVSFLVHLGTISRFIAGIFDLTLLSLGVFLAGVYIEVTFIFVGLVLGALAAMSAFVIQYLYAVILPIIIGGLIVVAVVIWLSHKKQI